MQKLKMRPDFHNLLNKTQIILVVKVCQDKKHFIKVYLSGIDNHNVRIDNHNCQN